MMVLQAHRCYPLYQNGGYCSQNCSAAKSFSTPPMRAFSAFRQSIDEFDISGRSGNDLQWLCIPDFSSSRYELSLSRRVCRSLPCGFFFLRVRVMNQ
ncbi:hypothetical protein [Scandinavium lactucae]|uniref:Uncharacterized protein n=1 Tax=Scandinavium lactucae TaxID=3095028 RepID=A0ABU4QSU3_9ENTR|nr:MULTISPECIES: hypothetical protein [unclassified Scandinavium]MDX6042343.1 hypothetical protein [Scandinavium sp. V105_6]MDX6052344.1 hypothetical protein [Scandinavium sp. V105_1]